LAITPSKRIFLGFPRRFEAELDPALAELKDGRLVAFPDHLMTQSPAPAPENRFVSIQGMTTDIHGNIWAVDDGRPIGQSAILPGGAKVIGFDPETGKVAGKVVLHAPALLPDSHLNDLRIDVSHGEKGTAYITDSSFGYSPALIVVDLATGRQRRVLGEHKSTQAEQGFVAVLENVPMRYKPPVSAFPTSGVNGITLSADSSRLYYSPLTSRRLYSIGTDLLADFALNEQSLAAAVVDEGEKGMSDGLATDAKDRIYISASEHNAIWRRYPNGDIEELVSDPRILWPDGLYATNEHIYFTVGQSHRRAEFHGGRDLRQHPYYLMRAPLSAPEDIDLRMSS
jgi:sugar lactone lactonase YvrE